MNVVKLAICTPSAPDLAGITPWMHLRDVGKIGGNSGSDGNSYLRKPGIACEVMRSGTRGEVVRATSLSRGWG